MVTVMKKDADGERLNPVEWYSVKDAAEYLGVSEPTIFRWMKENVLSFYKVGGATRFTREGLNAVIEKSTGSAEAQAAQGRCAACGHGVLIEGQVQGSGRLYFHPSKAKFWVLTDSMIPTTAMACAACGHIQWHTDTAKLKRISKEIDDKLDEK
jgi:excisionase family DNA binding protein